MLDKINSLMIDPPVATADSVTAAVNTLLTQISEQNARIAALEGRPYVPPSNDIAITVTPNQVPGAQSLTVGGTLTYASGSPGVVVTAREQTTNATLTLDVSVNVLAATFTASKVASSGSWVVTAKLSVGADSVEASTPPITIAAQQADTPLVVIPTGGLRLDSAEYRRLWGAAFIQDGLGNLYVGSYSTQARIADYRRRVTIGGAIDEVRVYVPDNYQNSGGYAGGNGGTLRCRVFRDDGTSDHKILAGSEPIAYGSLTLSMTAGVHASRDLQARTIDMTSVVPAAAGEILHFVFDNTDGTPGTNWCSVNCFHVIQDHGRPNRWASRDDVSAFYAGRALGDGAQFNGADVALWTWTEVGKEGVRGDGLVYNGMLQIKYADNQIEGQVCFETGNIDSGTVRVKRATSSAPIRMRFTPAVNEVMRGLSLHTAFDIAGSANVLIKRGSTVLRSLSVSETVANYSTRNVDGNLYGKYKWYGLTFDALELVAGTVYDVEVTPVGSARMVWADQRTGADYGFVNPASFTQGQAQHYVSGAWIDFYHWNHTQNTGNSIWRMVFHRQVSNPAPGGGGGTLTESEVGATLTGTTGYIYDGASQWTLTAGRTILRDGVAAGFTANVDLVLYWPSVDTANEPTIFQRNTGGSWYVWTASGWKWVPSGDPRVVAASPDGTALTSASGSIVDSGSVTWALTGAGGQVVRGGVIDSTTADVVTLLWFGGAVYQENNVGKWWKWNGTGWVFQVNADPRDDAVTPPVTPTPTGTVLWQGDRTISAKPVGMHFLSWPTGVAYRLKSPDPTFPAPLVRSWNAGDQTPGNNGVAWSNIETANNVFNYTNLDTWVNAHYGRGSDLMFSMGFWKPAYVSSNGEISSKTPPTDLTKVRRFIKNVCLRYPTKIKWIDPYNEPNFSANEGWDGTAAQLVAYHAAVYDGVQDAKGIDPTVIAKVCLPSFVDESSDWSLLATYLAASSSGRYPKDITDGAAQWHFYEFAHGYGGTSKSLFTKVSGTGGVMVDRITKMRQVLATGGFTNAATIPIIDSEHGFYGTFFQGLSIPGQAALLERMLADQACLGVECTVLYAADSFGSADIPPGYPIDPYGTPLEDPPIPWGLCGGPSYHSETAAAITNSVNRLAGKRVVLLEQTANNGRRLWYHDGTSVTF